MGFKKVQKTLLEISAAAKSATTHGTFKNILSNSIQMLIP
jgi:hypothetical protein